MGRDKESEQSLRQVLELQRRVLGPEQPETAVTVYNLGVLAAKSGRTDEALSLLRSPSTTDASPLRCENGRRPGFELPPWRSPVRSSSRPAKERAAAQKEN